MEVYSTVEVGNGEKLAWEIRGLFLEGRLEEEYKGLGCEGTGKDWRIPIMAGAKIEKGSPAAGNLKEPTSEDSAILGLEFSSSWEQ